MDATPRLRSAFPSTPGPNRREPPPRFGDVKPSVVPVVNTLKPPPSENPSQGSLIPEHILDAPSQRLFAFSLFVLLQTWKIFDFVTLQESEEQSLWLFMKWLALDGMFLFGLPSMRIPWLEWSPSTMTLLFCLHAFMDGMLMFRIPIPLGAGMAALGRSIWGAYELAISEHSVNPRAIMFNESLILGRQIVHILPEGTAVLNPDNQAFCIDSSRTEARLPIKINSTNPIAMELLRVDLDTDDHEAIHISKSHIKTMHREAARLLSYSDKPNEPKTLYYTVKKPGLYVLQKVVDESNLEVARKHQTHTPVVPCPRAEIMQSAPNRCRGELYDNDIEVFGTPPLTVRYRKVVNHRTQNATFESIMPEDFFSPLTRQDGLVLPKTIDTSWAKAQSIRVPLTDTLSTAGNWVCSIQEVQDGFGNKISYAAKDHQGQDKHLSTALRLHQVITVHERPLVNFKDCSPQNPLKVAKDKALTLPLNYGSTGQSSGAIADTVYNIEFAFTPEISLPDPDTAATAQSTFSMKSSKLDSVTQPGMYTIRSVSTEFCPGEVLEPASCLVQNPPQPQLTIHEDPIFDKCAGRPIGLRVDLDLVGTPPFEISYRVMRVGDKYHSNEKIQVNGLRGDIKLTPREAGHYRYEFIDIKDRVYGRQKLHVVPLEQDVKPSASAIFRNKEQRKTLCIEDSATFDVLLQGEGPFDLEYELIHGGKRTKHSKTGIDSDHVSLTTEQLRDGGDYSIALISVTDRMGCKEFPSQEEARFSVRHSKPKVGFGHIEGRRSIDMLEDRQAALPLRLEGEAPWTIRYVDAAGTQRQTQVREKNDKITASKQGIYELLDVHDSQCPGTVDEAAKIFQIGWISRPDLRVAPSDAIERAGNNLVRTSICEGLDDFVEILFKGAPPYYAHYVQKVKPVHGTVMPKQKELRSAVNVGMLQLDTSQAGDYEYEFTQLKDANYDHNQKHFNPFTIKQRVHPRPSVAFAIPGKTYSYCSVESDGEEVIPIVLTGQPPFDIEIELKHHVTSRSETISLNGITGRKYNIRIPHTRLQQGQSSVLLRRISDSNGCARTLDSTTPRVQISVHDPPSITPLETTGDFCVGDRLNFALTGAAPFNIFYTFEGAARKAVAGSSTFRRLAERPGDFVITGVQDSASACRASTNLTSRIHGLPSARVSHGREAYADIHEGGTVEILFEFGGTPPFEFTYTRSSNTARGAARAGAVLDMKSEVSESHSMRLRAHEEGTYEVVAIKDRFCGYAKPGVKLDLKEAQRRLTY